MKRMVAIQKRAYKNKLGICYLIILIMVSLFIIGKSVSICLDTVKTDTIGIMARDMFYSITDELIKQLFPNLRYIEQYGVEDTLVYENVIPEYYYEDEETKSVETVMALEQQPIHEPLADIAQSSVEKMGTTFTKEQLADTDFVLNNFYVVDSTTKLLPSEVKVKKLLKKDLTIDVKSSDYKILIYHTHGSETFKDSREGVLEDSIIGVGDTLTEILESKYGIHVYHDRTVYDMVDGKLDRSYAYNLSKKGAKQILESHPSIEVVIDLHRDGVSESTHLVTTINGKPTAKVMLLNGVSRFKKSGDISHLHNPYRQDNLAFSMQMYLKGRELYEDFFRKIYVRAYCYNLNLMPRATLVEAGAQNNTLEEMNNAMEPLAEVLYQVLSGGK